MFFCSSILVSRRSPGPVQGLGFMVWGLGLGVKLIQCWKSP